MSRHQFVFLLSPTGRSGTNYLRNLLVAGELCQAPLGNVLPTEDWYLANSDALIDYSEQVRKHQTAPSRAESFELDLLQGRLLRELGEALKRTVDAPGTLPVVLKTPSSKNVGNFFRIFGQERLLVLVRDGRDACESMVQSQFVKEYRHSFEHWGRRTSELVKFLDDVKSSHLGRQVKVVRYETIVASPAEIVMDIASWMGLETGENALSGLSELPVVGSSELGQSGDSFTYKTVAAPPGFNPVGRWNTWSDELRQLFKKVANQPLVDLGYEKDENW